MTDEKRATEDNRTLVLAFYVMVDVSQSMSYGGALESANEIMPKVADAIDASPMLADIVRFGAMDFSDDARVVLRLGDLRNVPMIPKFTTRGRTSYAAAFRLLRQEIERDVVQLRQDNFRVYRPVVFMITDGEPTDEDGELEAAYKELTDPGFKARPNILVFGVGTATKEALDPWVYPKTGAKAMRSYVARAGVEPKTAIAKATEALLGSIVASAQSVDEAGQSGGFVPPDDDDDDWI
ncbi:vWA domain-containing protein [Paractinoplanes atraurantiacus]|uniref:von Willebrand factor type A domain-containing protein n=1 Tax=Paractinoplanes atraurantiacus TaxID=1036182 RepID=A0A285JY69_9ACTN|nr:VWA domain-containing protein [Actinoplanes atraurantiacus]SNY65269.1 von Willebrand factor type A domain-containing protein [Actinoplanes atraurantiacus]